MSTFNKFCLIIGLTTTATVSAQELRNDQDPMVAHNARESLVVEISILHRPMVGFIEKSLLQAPEDDLDTHNEVQGIPDYRHHFCCTQAGYKPGQENSL